MSVAESDVYYDRSLRLWVVIFRDEDGNGIADPITGEEAHYFGSRSQASSFVREQTTDKTGHWYTRG
jgi:hypothetical protein